MSAAITVKTNPGNIDFTSTNNQYKASYLKNYGGFISIVSS